ncbi:hypothetical protein GCM10010394_45270 [Streptomyces crystallinus]|uniref:Uncharacterized protein n=1 Tax=Streptomyces crystallinus TaxID=68191 RepID=A0ABP3RGS4_9ACTN
MALVSAMATLLAALFLCLTAGGGASADPVVPRVHHGVAMSGAAQYSCPYDRGDCGLFPHADPAVLTAPPLDSPAPGGAHAAWAAAAPPLGAPVRGGAAPRAPDLHVLQVLRT